MAQVDVLVPDSLDRELRDRIAATDSRARVVLFDEHGSASDAQDPKVLLRSWRDSGSTRKLLRDYPSIEWVQIPSAGVEHLYPHLEGYKGIVTNGAGVYADPIAEWVISMLLAHSKRLPLLFEHFRNREWKSENGDEVGGKVLGVVGAGGIGSAVARRARGLDMHVIGLRASGQSTEHFSEMYTPDSLHEMLGKCDYVVICTPLTERTMGMFGEAEFRAMKPSGVLLNIARGRIVNTDALVSALAEGWIGGAYLDVTDPEPLPSDHPLWGLPNVIITAHTSGHSPRSQNRVIDLFCDNLCRWLDEQPLRNVVDLERGY